MVDMPRAEEALVEYIARNLVSAPDEVQVNCREAGRSIIVELSVASGDMGRVIGRSGRVANSIRALLRAIAAGENEYGGERRQRVILEIE